ncbi:endonuclease/exonuclease/phosphatase family protein [Myxococcus qinghaiensis]|uniref:endonuclease/exonuclease/phosphatase family protein n=1 Tax=Myxococcus qinghaiensis TaxID=2906758 RepID=UPI0020A7F7F2|nr:endonuclease/exonuclease/phosphatase family protein [Myxococcus qinghaiensis]MCP3165161.1 endonuclease/exonuclease/phosphatase family protein [Myxococcus qinghaiensis]
MGLKYVTSGIGAGKEKTVVGVANAATTNPFPTYLFTQAQKSLTFTATTEDPLRGVKSVKLIGELTVWCMAPRHSVYSTEMRSSQTFNLSNENSSATASPSRSVSLTATFKSYAEETRCGTGLLPYRLDLALTAHALDGNNHVLKTPLRRYVFVQSFKVATFNIRNGKNMSNQDSAGMISSYLELDHKVDIVLFQETHENTVSRLLTEPGLRELSLHRALSGNNDLAVFSRFPIAQNVVVPFSQPLRDYVHRWHYVVMDMGGFNPRIANLHLIATSVAEERDLDELTYRRQEMDEVMWVMRPPGPPSIIAGDFNAPVYKDNPPYTYIRWEWDSLYFTPPYKHFCMVAGCETTPEVLPRYNLDQIWLGMSTPGFAIVDAYTAFDEPMYEPPFISEPVEMERASQGVEETRCRTSQCPRARRIRAT